MNRLSYVLMAVAFAAYGQKIETQKTDRTRIMRVETALNHLTVIEVGDPVEQVAAGSASYKVEWRGNKVFVEPLEANAETNLFIWTHSGARLNYELAPAGRGEDAFRHRSGACNNRVGRDTASSPTGGGATAGNTGRDAAKEHARPICRGAFNEAGDFWSRYATFTKRTGRYTCAMQFVTTQERRTNRAIHLSTGSKLPVRRCR